MQPYPWYNPVISSPGLRGQFSRRLGEAGPAADVAMECGAAKFGGRHGRSHHHLDHRGRVHADKVRDHLPWLYKAYRNEILEYANEVAAEHVSAASDDRYGLVLNVQRGKKMRFECHVDSNPLTGLLFCTDHASGGELVVAHDTAAKGIDEIERRCSVIRPQAGHLIFFDAREYPHYARLLAGESETRIVAVMNFYTDSHPESSRPRELNQHLYGDTA
jgi:hypothetical protein